jgi:hypothetical protein
MFCQRPYKIPERTKTKKLISTLSMLLNDLDIAIEKDKASIEYADKVQLPLLSFLKSRR